MRIADPASGRVVDAAHSSPVPWGELARAECAVPQTLSDVVELTRAILHRKRKHCLVVLTARRGEAAPAVSAMPVREIVGSAIPIYFLREELTAHLAILRPPVPDVRSGGVRVYWPGVDSNPSGHPLVYSPAGESEQRILDALGRIFTPRAARLPVSLSPEQRVIVLERELDRSAQSHVRELSVLRARYEAWALGKQRHRSRNWPRPRRRGARHRQLEREVRLLIETQWGSYLPHHERERHPLRNYAVTPQFLSDVATAVGRVPMDRVAWVCSLVISCFNVKRVGLSSGPLKSSGDAPQMTRADGAVGWWCNLRRRSHPVEGPRVIYWAYPGDAFELVAVGYPKDTPQR